MNQTKSTVSNKAPGRNAPCPCGSGKKYRLCCLPPFLQKSPVDETQQKPQSDEDALLILQPTRGQITYETQMSLEHNVGIANRRLLRIARKPVAQARNELAKFALDAIGKGYLFDFQPRETFILWVDDDCFLLPGLVPTMMQAMNDPRTGDLDALFAWFSTRMPYAKPVAYRNVDDPESYPKPGIDCTVGAVEQIEAAGFHAVMMRPRLLQRLGENPFTPLDGHTESEDWAFCRRAKQIGARLAVGTALAAPHIDPADGSAYLPGMPPMMVENNTIRMLTLDHLSAAGTLKTGEVRQYGLGAIEAASAKADAETKASLVAEMEQRRVVSSGAV